MFKQTDSTLFLVPHRWQVIIEIVYKMILSLVTDNISGDKGQFFFPLVFTLFFFIVSLNLVGLVPYSFTLTSHLVVTFALSIAIFIGINIICIRLHGLEFFSLFFFSVDTKKSFASLRIIFSCNVNCLKK